MTDPKPKAMTAEEALKYLDRWIDIYQETARWLPDDQAALATLKAQVEENAALRAELDAARPLLARAKYLREEVLAFAGLMEAELRKHDDRAGWKECDPHWLLVRLNEEVIELVNALLDHSESLPHEAADVANFAMMIADVAGRLAYRASKEGKP